jgi:hypothetical protein
MPTSNTSPLDNESFKFKINGAEYYCYFLISSNPEPPISFKGKDLAEGILLTKSAIVDMDIHEDLFTPEITGTITINNPYNYIEDEHVNNVKTGEDYLHIKFVEYEVFEKGDPSRVGSAEPGGVSYQNEVLEYSFVITDESNSISKTDRSNNFKTYNLIDKNFYKLNRLGGKNLSFPKGPSETTMGNIIKDEIFGEEIFDKNIVDVSQWDAGNHWLNSNSGGKVNLLQKVHPGKHWRYSDVLKYLLRFNYSLRGTDNTLPVQSLLQFNRATGLYSLLPLTKYFDENEKLTIEALGIGDLNTESEDSFASTNKNNPESNPDIRVNRYTGMLHNTNLSTPYTTFTNEYFMDYEIKSQTLRGGQQYDVIKISEVIPQWTKSIIDKFKLVGGRAKSFIPFNNVNNDRPVKPFGLPNFEAEACKNICKAQMVSNLTFYNLQLTLDITGDTARRPGRFIDIFKLSDQGGSSDAKLLGKWFVTNVHHVFKKDKYQNIIMCVKPYVGPDYMARSVEEAEKLPLPWTNEVDPSYMPPPEELIDE